MAVLQSGNFEMEVVFHNFDYGNIYFAFTPRINEAEIVDNSTNIWHGLRHSLVLDNEAREDDFLLPFLGQLLKNKESNTWESPSFVQSEAMKIVATTWKTERAKKEKELADQTILITDYDGELKTVPYMDGVGDILDAVEKPFLNLAFHFDQSATCSHELFPSGKLVMDFKISWEQLLVFVGELTDEFKSFAAIHSGKKYWLGRDEY